MHLAVADAAAASRPVRVAAAAASAGFSTLAAYAMQTVGTRAAVDVGHTAALSWTPGSSVPSGSGGRRPRVAPEEISYSVVIVQCSKRGDARRAAAFLDEMLASRANVFVFNVVIAAFARKGDAAEAARWLNRMAAVGLAPNSESYTAVIGGCATASDPASAERWFELMEERHVPPIPATYGAMISSFAGRGDVGGARRWLSRMAHSRQAPDEAAYTAAIRCCANAQPPDGGEAQQLFREMRESQIQPTSGSLIALASAVGSSRRDELCRELEVDMAKAMQRRPEPLLPWGGGDFAAESGYAGTDKRS